MNTPIFDFLKAYNKKNGIRAHMPGHKGANILGCEELDITEISGADSLYEADGIIRESELNAASLFETGRTFYSTEGSSQCIKAMIYAVAVACGRKPVIAAARNVHKSFINAAALTDADVIWIKCKNSSSHYSGTVTAEDVEALISESNTIPDAVYITSPNYLGEITDIRAISFVTKKYGIPLIVDNAHGAYLKFFGMHPIELGADMCCDSAHKTLPSLTGGAYLHLSKNSAEKYEGIMRNALLLFGSTSPSYLIMASLDLCNKYISENIPKFREAAEKTENLKEFIKEKGFRLCGGEPLKITVSCNGSTLSEILREKNIECEFADRTSLVLMLSPQNTKNDFKQIQDAFSTLNPDDFTPIPYSECNFGKQLISIREAVFSPHKTVKTELAAGKICASPSVSCPPAVPVSISGEEITESQCKLMLECGIEYTEIVEKEQSLI